MKLTGIVRQVDNLDRIVIPKELCRTLGIEPRSPMELFVENSKIVIKKHDLSKPSAGHKGGVGIVRRVDNLDRIVIPKEICKNLGIVPKDSLEIFVDDDKLILGRYAPACIFCGSIDDLVLYKGKLVCKKCIEELKKSL